MNRAQLGMLNKSRGFLRRSAFTKLQCFKTSICARARSADLSEAAVEPRPRFLIVSTRASFLLPLLYRDACLPSTQSFPAPQPPPADGAFLCQRHFKVKFRSKMESNPTSTVHQIPSFLPSNPTRFVIALLISAATATPRVLDRPRECPVKRGAPAAKARVTPMKGAALSRAMRGRRPNCD